MPAPIAPQKRDAIITALGVTRNATQVMRDVGGVSHKTVCRVAAAAGIDLTLGKCSDEKRAAIIIALGVNANAKQVSKEVGGISSVAVWRIAKAAGIALTAGNAAKGGTRLSAKKRTAIIDALRENPNARQVAAAFGNVSHTMVCKIAAAENIELKLGRPTKAAKPQAIVGNVLGS